MQRPLWSPEELKVRTLWVDNLGAATKANVLMTFVNTFVLAVTQQTNFNAEQLGQQCQNFKPVYDVEVDYARGVARAKLYFRSFEATQVAMNLHGFQYEGFAMSVRRPPEFFHSQFYREELKKWNSARRLEVEGPPVVAAGSDESSAGAAGTTAGAGAAGGANGVPPPAPAPARRRYYDERWLPNDFFFVDPARCMVFGICTLLGLPSFEQIAIDLGLNKRPKKLSFLEAPLFMSEDQLKEIFLQFGPLKYFELMLHRDGGSRGFGMLEYDPEAEVDFDLVFECLNGFVVGEKALKVQHLTAQAATVSSRLFKNPALAQQLQYGLQEGRTPSPVVQLLNCVTEADILDDSDFYEVKNLIHKEASKYGIVEEVLIPRPSRSAYDSNASSEGGVGKIFVHYQSVTSARKFQSEINGRKFDDRVVCAAFYPSTRILACNNESAPGSSLPKFRRVTVQAADDLATAGRRTGHLDPAGSSCTVPQVGVENCGAPSSLASKQSACSAVDEASDSASAGRDNIKGASICNANLEAPEQEHEECQLGGVCRTGRGSAAQGAAASGETEAPSSGRAGPGDADSALNEPWEDFHEAQLPGHEVDEDLSVLMPGQKKEALRCIVCRHYLAGKCTKGNFDATRDVLPVEEDSQAASGTGNQGGDNTSRRRGSSRSPLAGNQLRHYHPLYDDQRDAMAISSEAGSTGEGQVTSSAKADNVGKGMQLEEEQAQDHADAPTCLSSTSTSEQPSSHKDKRLFGKQLRHHGGKRPPVESGKPLRGGGPGGLSGATSSEHHPVVGYNRAVVETFQRRQEQSESNSKNDVAEEELPSTSQRGGGSPGGNGGGLALTAPGEGRAALHGPDNADPRSKDGGGRTKGKKRGGTRFRRGYYGGGQAYYSKEDEEDFLDCSAEDVLYADGALLTDAAMASTSVVLRQVEATRAQATAAIACDTAVTSSIILRRVRSTHQTIPVGAR
eukprot:g2518.t1